MTKEEFRDYVDFLRLQDEISYDVYSGLIDGIYTLEQDPCDKCIYSTKDDYCQYDDITETIPPFEPCKDTISREAVLDYIHRILNQGTGKKKSFEFIQKYVEKLPPVKPQEPKTGHREYNDIYDHYLCGNCKTVVMDYDNFCPHCGAKMD